MGRAGPTDGPYHRGLTAGCAATLVSLIIVTYRSAALAPEAVRSALRSAERAGFDVEIIVIDNASDDGSTEVTASRFPGATVIRNDSNVGFGRACNQGFAAARGDWWLLLNPDARTAEDALGHLVLFATANPRAAAVAPRLVGAGADQAESAGMQPGVRAALGHFLFLNRLLPGDRGGPWRGFQLHRREGLGPRRVDWASAGALLLRPAAIRQVGGFDEAFFLYAEDVDLGRRLSLAGWQSWLVPAALAEHGVAASSGGVTDRWIVALHDYHARHASRLGVAAFDAIAGVGLAFRALVASTLLRSRPGGAVHAARMRIASGAALRAALRALSGR